jgi:hypothetical protein
VRVPGGVVGSHDCDEWRGNKEKERRGENERKKHGWDCGTGD